MPELSGAEANGDRATVTGDQAAHLAALWKAFEDSGAVSAHIAYRRHLSPVGSSGSRVDGSIWPVDALR